MHYLAVSVTSDISEMRRLARWVRDISHLLALPDDIAFRLDLCLEEAVHNIIKYGYSDQGPHQIDVKISYDADSLALEVEDDGIAFDPLSVPVLVRPSTLAEAKIGGWGVHLIRQFSDRCHYERRGEKNRLQLLFRVPSPEV
ncbi:MAG: ATP-binding protein [Gammaproteobacteria bacterium]